VKTYALITVHLFIAALLLFVACSEHPVNHLKGEWVGSDGKHLLKITDKTFAIDAESQIMEDYFVKNDTIFTSFEDNQPYTKYFIKRLDSQQLTLIDPDSIVINFKRK
jgi:hypothetical protein